MKRLIYLFLTVLFFSLSLSAQTSQQSTRKDRRLINAGNKLYRAQKFAEAKVKFREVLQINPQSRVANFNLALANVKLAGLNKDNDSISKKLLSEATEGFNLVAKEGKENSSLASKANYNLGNLQFESENYQAAIGLYKQALRLNPNFEDARRNLRIAQLKQQQQDQNQDKNQDNQDKDNKDQEQDKQDRNQDQQDQKDRQDRNQQQEQPKDNQLSNQAAEQILNAVENNEQRARQGMNKGDKAKGRNSRLKKW